MLRYGWEIYQFLVKGFAKANKRFPNPKEIKFIENTAVRIRNKLLESGVDLEKLNAEDAVKLYANPPKLPAKPKSKPAGIEALPLQDPKLREQALKKKLEAQNLQSRESLQTRNKPTSVMVYDKNHKPGMAGMEVELKNKPTVQDLIESGEITKGTAPKTDLAKIKDKIKKERETQLELFDQISGTDITDDMFANGGRVGYAYGSGLKLIQLLKQKGTSLKKALDKAFKNVFPTGDKKLDADRVVDDMLETYNIDRDAVDGYDILDAYDQAYKKINQYDLKKDVARKELIKKIKKINPNIDISEPKTASNFAKFAKENDPEGFKQIQKITDDINDKNKLITKNAENELIQARKNVGESQDFVGNDVKYDARLLAEELAQVRYKTDYSDLDLDSQIGLFDESYNHLLDLIQERGQIKGAINLRTGKNILTGKQERAPEALPGEDLVPPKKRTLNADGGLITLFTKK